MLEINWDSLGADGSARWANVPDDKIDALLAAAEEILGKPDTLV